MKRRSRIECTCGVSHEDSDADEDEYKGLWIQCASCLAWQHGACVGHRRAPRGTHTCVNPPGMIHHTDVELASAMCLLLGASMGSQ